MHERLLRHLIVLALIAALAFAAPANAQPACGDVLTQDTTLTADLNCGDAPLVIGAPDITLDLGGHRLTGVQGYRIVNWGHDGVTIRNGEILSDGGSILLVGVSGNLVSDIRAGGLLKGILVQDSHENRFVHNQVRSVSFAFTRSDRNVIAHNLVTAYESTLSLHDSDYNRVVDNVVWGGFVGTSLTVGGDHNQIRRNVLINNGLFVVRLNGANDTDFVANTIGSDGSSATPGGAQIQSSSRNRFVDNTLFGVAQGVDLRSGADNVFRGNDVSGAPLGTPQYVEKVPDGFAVAVGATGTLLRDNRVSGFDDDGIDVEAAGTRLRSNEANDNGDLGIEAVPGVVDLGGNSASGNGNPLQCTNVVCG